MSRRLLFAVWLAAWALGAQAQEDWRRVAVPTYTPAHFVLGQVQGWYSPRAAALARQALDLESALARGCPADGPEEARLAWRRSVAAWARLSAVAVGPLNERRSQRRIDFLPIRPARIADAVAAPGQDLELAGGAARGFGALEWLLWAAPMDAAHCAYALRLAGEIRAEAQALEQAFAARPALLQEDEALVAAMNESLNQWLGGVEMLRLQWLVKPLSDMQQRGRPAPLLPRQFADQDAAAPGAASREERQLRWESLQELLVGTAVPAPGQGLVSVATYLRGKGLNPLADRLLAQARLADQALGQAGDGPASLELAARRLAELKALVENEVTPVLDIRVGFSDADGD